MRLIRTSRAMADWSARLHQEGVLVGLVPTMGALHAGHRALIRAARLTCDAVVVSVFVNPLQFAEKEDFTRYPRRLRADAALCRREGVDLLFAPRVDDLYPATFATTVQVAGLTTRWEGARRPGHFTGVSTVVTKLLALIRPQVTFVGQKDYQQAVLIRRLVQDLHLETAVMVCPTIREADGLAVSSRNEYLSPAQRRVAPILFRALDRGRTAILGGERSAAAVRRIMRRALQAERRARPDYLAVCDPETLIPLHRVTRTVVLLGAIRIGRLRLIDNVLVGR